jgi:hypothetical protein
MVALLDLNIVTDLLKTLLGNGLINTPRYAYATIGGMLQVVARQHSARQWTGEIAIT